MLPRGPSLWRKAECFPVSLSSGTSALHRENCCKAKNRLRREFPSPIFQTPRRGLSLRLNKISMQRLHPRSPYEKLGGFVHLPRLIDKARLHRKGLLNGYNYKTVGFDKHLLAFLKVVDDAFEEIANQFDDDEAVLDWVRKNGARNSAEAIEQWNHAMISRHP